MVSHTMACCGHQHAQNKGVMSVKIERIIFFVFMVLMLCVFLLIYSDSQPTELRNKVEKGKLYCFINDKQYWSELTDYCVKENYLYMLFGDKGVIKVYNSDGVYQKSYAFWKTKGASSLHIDNKYVYLIDQGHNYYVFSSGEFVDFVKYNDYGTYLQKMATFTSAEDQKKTDSAQYYLKYASVYRKNADNSSIQVIHRPLSLMFFQGIIPFAIITICLVFLFVLKLLSRKVS